MLEIGIGFIVILIIILLLAIVIIYNKLTVLRKRAIQSPFTSGRLFGPDILHGLYTL